LLSTVDEATPTGETLVLVGLGDLVGLVPLLAFHDCAVLAPRVLKQ
jgi:hypothetical protein